MRSGLDATTLALWLGGDYDCHFRLKNENGSGSFISLEGRYSKLSVKFPDPVEPVGSLSFEFVRDSTAFGDVESLAPLIVASDWNEDDLGAYSPLFQLGRQVTLEVHLTDIGDPRPADGSTDWYEIFRGIIAKVSWPKYEGQKGSVSVNGLGAVLQHQKSEVRYTYAMGTSLETVVTQVLTNNGHAGVPVHFPVATASVLPNTYEPGFQKTVWSQLTAIANSLGWVCYYRYRGHNPPELTFFEPERDKVAPDMTVRVDDFDRLDLDEAEVRNVGILAYVDEGNVEQLLPTVEDAASIAKYGGSLGIRRPFFIKLDEFSPVRTEAAATALLNAALSDVADPDIVAEANCRALVFSESGVDLYTFEIPDRFADSNQDWALFSNNLEIAPNREPRSFVGVRGTPTAGGKTWKTLAVNPQRPDNRTYTQPVAPTGELRVGDIWFDSSNNNHPWRWSGTVWVDIQDYGIEDRITSADTVIKVLNGGFEQGFSYWGGLADTDIALDTVIFKSGTQSLRLNKPLGGTVRAYQITDGRNSEQEWSADNYRYMSVTPGDQIWVHGFYRTDGVIGARAAIRIFDDDLASIGHNELVLPATVSWTPYSVIFTIPANIYFIVVGLFTDVGGSAGAAYFDDVDIERLIDSPRIANEAVLTQHIDDEAVNTAKLLDDAVTFEKVAARAIGTQHLFVGSFDNLAKNGGFEQVDPVDGVGAAEWRVSSAGGTWTHRNSDARSGDWCLEYNTAGQINFAKVFNQHDTFANGGAWVECVPGDEFYAEVWIRSVAGGGNKGQIRLEWFSASGILVSGSSGNEITPTTAYQKSFVNAIAPAGAVRMVPVFQVQPNAVGGVILFDDYYCRRKVDGLLVVDGSILTQHLSANSVTVEKLLSPGGNLAEDPGFEFGAGTWTPEAPWSIIQNAVNARTGSFYARYGGPASQGTLRNGLHFDAQEGQTFSVKGWMRGELSADGDAFVRVSWMDIDHVEIGTSSGDPTQISAISDGTWREVSVLAEAPAGTVFGRAEFTVTGWTQGAWWADDIYCIRAIEAELIVAGILKADVIVASESFTANTAIFSGSLSVRAGDGTIRHSLTSGGANRGGHHMFFSGDNLDDAAIGFRGFNDYLSIQCTSDVVFQPDGEVVFSVLAGAVVSEQRIIFRDGVFALDRGSIGWNGTLTELSGGSNGLIMRTTSGGGHVTISSVGNLTMSATGDIILPGLPTADPGVTGALWNNGGFLAIS